MAPCVQAAALLHAGTAAFPNAASASCTLVVADALIHALVTRAFHQVSHAGCATCRVPLLLHAALGTRETCSTRAAALVQCTIKACPSSSFPNSQVLLVGARSALLNCHFLILIRIRQSIMVVHLHSTELAQFQAAIAVGCACIIYLQSLQRRLCSCQCDNEKGCEKLHSHS